MEGGTTPLIFSPFADRNPPFCLGQLTQLFFIFFLTEILRLCLGGREEGSHDFSPQKREFPQKCCKDTRWPNFETFPVSCLKSLGREGGGAAGENACGVSTVLLRVERARPTESNLHSPKKRERKSFSLASPTPGRTVRSAFGECKNKQEK